MPLAPRKGRRLRPDEAPTIYLGMRQYNRTLKKMQHVRGHSFVLRYYTPGRARRVIQAAFQADIATQQREMDERVGQIIGR